MKYTCLFVLTHQILWEFSNLTNGLLSVIESFCFMREQPQLFTLICVLDISLLFVNILTVSASLSVVASFVFTEYVEYVSGILRNFTHESLRSSVREYQSSCTALERELFQNKTNKKTSLFFPHGKGLHTFAWKVILHFTTW